MKTLTTILLFAIVTQNSIAQENHIETKSVLLQDFISFIAENYKLSAIKGNSEEDNNENTDEEITAKNITFLIETPRRSLSQEDVISLKQSFRFLSKRLLETDNISIVAYSGTNGLVLAKTSPKSLKKVLHAINNIKEQIDKECDDGISYAYEYANKIHEANSSNTVVMIRNPNPNPISYNATNHSVSNIAQDDNKSKKNNGAIILTAITLLPEIIAVIKD